MVGYHYNAKCILAESVKNRTVSILTETWQLLNNKFGRAGVELGIWVQENEKLKILIDESENNHINHPLVPSDLNLCNLAEPVIHTFKNYLKVQMATYDPKFFPS